MKITPFEKAPWFSIDEDAYLMYLLKGYEIQLSPCKQYVHFSLDGLYHREDGPAIIWSSGTVQYFQNDKLHRDDGPAIIYKDGSVQYWQNGNLHRDDGPAIIDKDGSVQYWMNGSFYSKEEYYEALKDGTY